MKITNNYCQVKNLKKKNINIGSLMSLMSTGLYFRQTLVDDCPTYFDSETRLLDAPMVIRVADQVF